MQIKDTYREGNQLADKFANIGCEKIQNVQIYENNMQNIMHKLKDTIEKESDGF